MSIHALLNGFAFRHAGTSTRGERRQRGRRAVNRACLEALEGRRLMSFSGGANYPVGEFHQQVVTGDFNNDGRLDLATANAGGSVSVLPGNADGTFQPATTSPIGISSGSAFQSVAVGDFNDDGMLDLATGTYNYDGWGSGVSILMGNGDCTFDPGPLLMEQGGMASWFVATGDLNADDKMDLVVTSTPNVYSGGMSGVAVLLGRGDGTFANAAVPWKFSDTGQPNYATVLADFNGDGKTDVGVPTGWGSDAVVEIYLNNGDGSLAQAGNVVTYTSNESIETVAATVGDFNGDGRLDLVAVSARATANFSSASILLGNGDGTFQPWQPLAAWGAAGDFNGDGALDLIDAGYVFLGNGDGSFATPPRDGFNPSPTVVADFNGDARLDAAVGSKHYDTVSVLLNDGDWPFPPPAVSVSDATVTEGNTGTVNATFTLTLSHASDVDVIVHYATANITAAAGGDYTAASGTVTIPARQKSRTFTVAVAGDRLAEASETFAVNFTAPTNASIGDGQGIGTIVDNEPRVSINSVSKSEGNGKTTIFSFTVSLSAAYDQAVTVNYATAGGTATAGTDYQSKTGSVTFAPAETIKMITVVVVGDKQREAHETFFIDLWGPSSNALLSVARGIGTIFNDDSRL
jgi:hypothetical protein